ncbi:hypothetical protein CH302_19235 [Rhodococcus sp. 15-2388-1-1a]|uniref:hypothetical protein n=1 Tax=Nocardiaceae TaxID=85025 RepID=UPI00056BA8DC|nr:MULTISPECIES: hypothetical protein [Rhodococcus]OZE95076.1 hypothetical protein CH302_19235 [Rhodococcus sp. 15-2388-1-1a]
MAPSNALTTIGRSDIPETWKDRLDLAKELSTAGMLPTQYVGKPGNILAAQMASNALDIPLWVAFQELNHINGKTGLSAFMMRALIIRAGHDFELVEDDAVHAKIKVKRKEWQAARYVDYQIQDARTAGLIKPGGNYDKNPAAMMVARATTKGAKLYFADVLAGFGQSAEELEDERQAQASGGRIEKPAEPVVADVAPESAPVAEPAAEDKQAESEPVDAEVVPDPAAEEKQESEPEPEPAAEGTGEPEPASDTADQSQLDDPQNLQEFIDQVVIAKEQKDDAELQRLWKLGRESEGEWLGYDYENVPLRKWILDARKSVSAAKAGA